MSAEDDLIATLELTRKMLAHPDNDFSWSSWEDADAAVSEINTRIAEIQSGKLPPKIELDVLYAVTGPIQEVSLSSGWGRSFLDLANRYDLASDLAYRVLPPQGPKPSNQHLKPHIAYVLFGFAIIILVLSGWLLRYDIKFWIQGPPLSAEPTIFNNPEDVDNPDSLD